MSAGILILVFAIMDAASFPNVLALKPWYNDGVVLLMKGKTYDIIER